MDKKEELQYLSEALDSYKYLEEIEVLLDRLHLLGIEDREIISYLNKEEKQPSILQVVEESMETLNNYKNNHYLFEELITLIKSEPRNELSIYNKMVQINNNDISDEQVLDVIYRNFDQKDHYQYMSKYCSDREIQKAKIEAKVLNKIEEDRIVREKEISSLVKKKPESFAKIFFTEILPVIFIIIILVSYGLKSCSNNSTYYSNDYDDYDETFYKGR